MKDFLSTVLERCLDGSCCCLTPKIGAVVMSLIGLAGSVVDHMSGEPRGCKITVKEHFNTLKIVLVRIFQMVNFLLLLSAIFEVVLLVKIYVWYTMAYCLLGLVTSIMELLLRALDGSSWIFVFLADVMFYFVLYRCIPLVDAYWRYLDINGEQT